MSDDTDDEQGVIDYSRGGPIRTNATGSYSDRWGPNDSRESFAEHIQGRRNNLPQLWDAVGYPGDQHLDFRTYYNRYKRDGIAEAIIDRPANSTWQDQPSVEDHGDPEDDEGDNADNPDTQPGSTGFSSGEPRGQGNQTDFEKAVSRFLTGDPLRRRPTHRMRVADRMATLGQFSIIVIGFDDGREMDSPVGGVEDDSEGDDDPEFGDRDDGLTGLNYLATYAQDRVEIETKNSDMTSPRFRLPETYTVQVEGANEAGRDYDVSNAGDDETEEIHWTRVIHIPEGADEDDLRGGYGLADVINNLLNIDKITAASGEGYWRSGYRGIQVKPPSNNQGAQVKAGMDSMTGGSELARRIGRMYDNFQRTVATTAELEPMQMSVESPEDHFQTQIKVISAAKEFPQSYLLGNETGERATSEDRQFWDRKIASRRNTFAGPVIFEPLVDRLVEVGVLPEPVGGKSGYRVHWPPLHEPSEKDKAEVARIWAEAYSKMSGGDPKLLFSNAELRSRLNAPPRFGSAVELTDEEQQAEERRQRVVTDPNESDPVVQDQAEEMGMSGGVGTAMADGGSGGE